ncbi:MAG: hypothetical protein FWF52_08750 [Candidatus Azobacteroides sp.]|nr:hypothetical protein [Candidatus Azobacteroides sp.]
MYQKFTQEKREECCGIMRDEKSTNFFAPRKEAIRFVTQFAYTYHAERKLPARLSGMLLN